MCGPSRASGSDERSVSPSRREEEDAATIILGGGRTTFPFPQDVTKCLVVVVVIHAKQQAFSRLVVSRLYQWMSTKGGVTYLQKVLAQEQKTIKRRFVTVENVCFVMRCIQHPACTKILKDIESCPE
jgi:hypothetical protein